ncbi:MAG: glycosyltransferase family 4 protein [Desulfitobacteriaceae bacterium]
MKIVFPVISLETGGGARFIYQLANALLDKGHQVEIVIPENNIISWPVRAKITHAEALTPSAIPSCDFILPNFFTTVHPAWESKKGQVVRLSLGYEPLWVKEADFAKQTYLIGAPIITISQWHRQVLLNHTGLNSTVVSPGVDTAVFHPYAKLSGKIGSRTIFYIVRSASHGYTWKGTEDFFEASRQVKKLYPNFSIYVVVTEKLPFQSPIPCIIKTANTDIEMAQNYAQADLFVYASSFEAFGLPPLEAMACGTAVITTDCGGIRDYAKHGTNCLMVPPKDVGQLTSAMYRLLNNDQERQRLAVTGLHHAQSWTWKRTADQIEAFLLSLKR